MSEQKEYRVVHELGQYASPAYFPDLWQAQQMVKNQKQLAEKIGMGTPQMVGISNPDPSRIGRRRRPTMARTLTDMTPEERQACVGMWCDNLASAAKEPSPVVLVCVQGDLCWVLHPDLNGEWSRFSLGSVAPRPDLMRAWNPDGKPAPGEWEERVHQDGIGDRVWFARQRRYITEWESDDE